MSTSPNMIGSTVEPPSVATSVTTLALGSWPRQGFARLWAKREAGSHTTYSRECEKVWGNELSHPKGVQLWELEFRWTSEFLEGDWRGQNSMDWGDLYIIWKLLERRYLKWAPIIQLDIWNTSYGQKKGWESNWQFDSRPLKVGNRPNFCACRWRATYCWKALDEGYNFSLDLISNQRSAHKVMAPQSRGSPNLGNFGTPTWESQDKKPFGCGMRGKVQSIL